MNDKEFLLDLMSNYRNLMSPNPGQVATQPFEFYEVRSLINALAAELSKDYAQV